MNRAPEIGNTATLGSPFAVGLADRQAWSWIIDATESLSPGKVAELAMRFWIGGVKAERETKTKRSLLRIKVVNRKRTSDFPYVTNRIECGPTA